MKTGTISPRSTQFLAVANETIQSLKSQLSEKQILIDSMKIVQNNGETLNGEIDKKEREINSLNDDLKKAMEALKICGSDIVSVREDNSKLKKQFLDQQDKLKVMELEISEAFQFVEEIVEFKGPTNNKFKTDPSDNLLDPLHYLEKYDHKSLLIIASEMGRKLRAIEEERIEAKRYIFDAKASKSQLDALTKAHSEMQEAHLQQSKFIQKLQKQTAEVTSN